MDIEIDAIRSACCAAFKGIAGDDDQFVHEMMTLFRWENGVLAGLGQPMLKTLSR